MRARVRVSIDLGDLNGKVACMPEAGVKGVNK